MRARTRSRMLALVRQWETSGETRRAFVQRHGVTLSCFDYWRRQVLDGRQDDRAVAFAPVRVVADDPATGAGVIEVVLASGERVVIREGASGDMVRAVVAALRASC
jgi:transposase-like protein